MTIDGINIYATYKATLLYGSLANFVQYPPLKKPLVNDWAEYDGLEVDLVTPILDSRDLNLEFLIEEPYIDSFVTFLMLKTYRDYYSIDLLKTYKLRFKSISGINKPQGKCTITISLADDFPLLNYSYVEPFLSAQDSGISIDGKNISTYGLFALEGTENEFEKIVTAKEKLEVTNKLTNGVLVAEQVSKKQHYQVNLKFFIRQTQANFFKGYDAFLYDLKKPNARTFLVQGNSYSCYYISADCRELLVYDGEVWCNFDVKIEIL